MPFSPMNRVQSFRQKLDVTQNVFARVLGVTERNVLDLENGRNLIAATKRRLTELERLHHELSKVVKPGAIGTWLSDPNGAFDGEIPADLITNGKIDLLWRMIFELRSGCSS